MGNSVSCALNKFKEETVQKRQGMHNSNDDRGDRGGVGFWKWPQVILVADQLLLGFAVQQCWSSHVFLLS